MDLDRLIPAAFSAMEAFGEGVMSVVLAIPIALALAGAVWFIKHLYRFVQRELSGELPAIVARLTDDAVLASRAINRGLQDADDPARSTPDARGGSHG